MSNLITKLSLLEIISLEGPKSLGEVLRYYPQNAYREDIKALLDELVKEGKLTFQMAKGIYRSNIILK